MEEIRRILHDACTARPQERAYLAAIAALSSSAAALKAVREHIEENGVDIDDTMVDMFGRHIDELTSLMLCLGWTPDQIKGFVAHVIDQTITPARPTS